MAEVVVRRSAEEVREVDFPLYGHWVDDVFDGRTSWETWFKISADGFLRTVTHWTGDTNKWSFEAQKIDLRLEAGQYLKHREIQPREFYDAADQIVEYIRTA